jgi:hypothetical protein
MEQRGEISCDPRSKSGQETPPKRVGPSLVSLLARIANILLARPFLLFLVIFTSQTASPKGNINRRQHGGRFYYSSCSAHDQLVREFFCFCGKLPYQQIKRQLTKPWSNNKTLRSLGNGFAFRDIPQLRLGYLARILARDTVIPTVGSRSWLIPPTDPVSLCLNFCYLCKGCDDSCTSIAT